MSQERWTIESFDEFRVERSEEGIRLYIRCFLREPSTGRYAHIGTTSGLQVETQDPAAFERYWNGGLRYGEWTLPELEAEFEQRQLAA